MIEAKTIKLPLSADDFGRHRTGKNQHFKCKEFIYISILEQLEAYLNFEDVSQAVSRPKATKQHHLITFEDRLAFQSSPLYHIHQDALQIHVYLDEVSMTGDRGSRSKKNKLVYVYFSLGNLEAKYRSNFKVIFLLSIFHNTTMSRFGLNVLLRPLVNDFKKLEKGIEMSIGGKPSVIRGTLSAVIADNLVSHQIGGFKVGFSKGFRKCRFCLGTDDEIQNNFFD